MKLDSLILDMESLTKNANAVKEMTLKGLLTDGVISREQALFYAENWQFIVIKRSWFKTWLEKFIGKKGAGDEEGYAFKFVQFEPRENKKGKSNPK